MYLPKNNSKWTIACSIKCNGGGEYGAKTVSRAKKKVKVLWNFLNQPSKSAIEDFNMVLAKAQLRAYQGSLKN